MNLADVKNGGARAVTAFADQHTLVAGAGTDNAEQNGAWVDRKGAAYGTVQSAKLVITGEATLAQDETLSIAVNIQEATDGSGSGAADFGTALASTVVATGDTGGSTEQFTAELDFDLSGAEQFIRSQITADASASGTDTATYTATWVFFGSDRNPISASLI